MRENLLRAEYTINFFFFSYVSLITARSNKAEDCSHFFIADCMSEAKCGERTTQSAIFPLYSFTHDFTTNRLTRTPNLNSKIVSSVSKSLGLPYKPNSDGNESDSFAPINLLDYIYAISDAIRH